MPLGKRLPALGLPVLVAVAAVVVGIWLSQALDGYFVYLGVTVIVSAIAILGLGIVTGSAGMISLCQLTFAAIGAWFVAALSYIHAPGGFIVWLMLAAAASAVAGIIIGLPALRLRGVNLAVVTLALAAAADVTLTQIQFPGSSTGLPVERPEIFLDDRQYFVFSVIVLVVCGLVVHFLQRGRWGSSWKAVAFSERGMAAVGSSVARAKLTAFAASATLGGVSGGLLAGQVQLPLASGFTPIESLAMYVLAIISGSYLIDMAVFGGLLWTAVPELLKRLGIPQDWAFVIFGILGVQALTSGTNLGQGIRNQWWKRRRESAKPLAPLPESSATHDRAIGESVLVVDNLSVAFGEVAALDGVSLTVHENEILGLIGPNGAGKSTLVDAVDGFLPRHTGSIRLDGRELQGQSPVRRARQGIRRTFQQDRVPPSLTVGAYVRFVAIRRVSDQDIDHVLAFFACPPAGERLLNVDVGTRRIIEVAANMLAKPRVLILDEPAAGLSHENHLALGERLTAAPLQFGVSIILIEHDLDLVRTVCDSLTVLDYGEVIATGDRDEVLADENVARAYMGETELAAGDATDTSSEKAETS